MADETARPTYKAFTERAPDVYAGLAALTKAVDAAGLDKGLTELAKLRASQLNGCVFCLKFHLGVARKAGVPQEKLDLLAAWREAPAFTAREKAALAWTEELTRLGAEPASEEAWAVVLKEFSRDEAVFLTVAVATINAWNRIGIAFNFAPPA